MSYSQFASITIDYTQCGTVDSSNFTSLVSFTATQIKSVANGGQVQNTLTRNGVTVPADLVFTSDSLGASLLKWDIESWNATTGAILAWVLIPTLSTSVNTVIYVFVGSSGITTWQGGTQGSAYDSSTMLMLHLSNGVSLNALDWSANGWSSTISGATATAGQIDGAANFNGSSNFITYAGFALGGVGNLSISAWVFTNNNTANQMIVEKDPVNSSWEFFLESGDAKIRGGSGTDVFSIATVPVNSTWHHMAVTLTNGSPPTGTYFLDSINSGANTAGSALVDSAGNLRIGCYNAGGGYFWQGNLDEIRVSNVIRSQSWITAMFNSQNTPATFTTVGSWTAPPSSLAFPPLLPEMVMHSPYPHILVRL